MNHSIKLCLLFISFSISSFGQTTNYSGYNWNSFPAYKNNDSVKSINGAIIELDRRIIEYYINRDNYFEEIYVYHQKIKITTNDALNKYNKIYIPLNNVLDILTIRARCISPSGKVTQLSDNSIKKIENMENSGDYSIFAVEGAEVGGEIEYFYILRKTFISYYTVWAQNNEVKLNFEVIIQYPSNLEFITKSYNNFPEFKFETDSNKITTAHAYVDYIPAIQEETYAFYKSNLMRYELSLAYNNYRSTLRLYSWNTACASIYSGYYELTPGEQKAVDKYISACRLDKEPLENKIRIVENKVKNEIAISNEIRSGVPLNEMLQLKQTNLSGATRLFIALFNSAHIPFELVYTSNKEDNPFDPEFNCWNFLDQFLIYFPDLNKSMIPDKINYRLGVLPSEYTGQFGMFMHPLSLSKKLNTLAYEIKKLPAETCEMNTDSMFIYLTINAESQLVTREVRNVSYGQRAQSYQSFWQDLNKEKELELLNNVFSVGEQKAQIDHYTVQNEKQNDIGLLPFITTIHETSNNLIEAAGNDLIIKVGETIGPQIEMYQENIRKLPIQTDRLTNYYRRIEVTIPKGYKNNKLDVFNMNEVLNYNNKIGCMFTSNYTLEGDKLIIISREYYTDEYYPVSEYPVFRTVVNASANFNKCKLVLTKQ